MGKGFPFRAKGPTKAVAARTGPHPGAASCLSWDLLDLWTFSPSVLLAEGHLVRSATANNDVYVYRVTTLISCTNHV
ncbi:hypothetical protein AAFF_G00235800 [Aldrovandia affinis]|uniref:Uncharacterized protein n=1 Tax=Aldrovandia affinis TaxID=143900 RepID=A0AAD7SV47_9TELE|nr:hypothetical protein AAFF_G00235800 [Aldrovandia affinis]